MKFLWHFGISLHSRLSSAFAEIKGGRTGVIEGHFLRRARQSILMRGTLFIQRRFVALVPVLYGTV